MGRLVVSLVLLNFSLCCYAQDHIQPGLLRAQLTLSPQVIFDNQETCFSLHGSLEGYINKNLSIVGEGYYYLGSMNSSQLFNYNHCGFFGVNKHFTKNNNDLYFGLQPGIAYTLLEREANTLAYLKGGVNPLFSTTVGYNYFFYKYFHFAVQSRFVLGEHSYGIKQNLSGFFLSATLGFNINCVSSKASD